MFPARMRFIVRLFSILVTALATLIVIGCGGSVEAAGTAAPSDVPTASVTFTPVPDTPTPAATAAPTAPPTQTPVPTPTSVSVVAVCPAAQTTSDAANDVPPNVFLGTATLDGEIVPDGTNVTACIDGEPVATTLVSDGRFLIITEQRIPSLEGREITFSVDGIDAKETAVWTMGGAELIDLSAER